jgi:tRNA(Ile2) C34 agmatinyltransferase TiaS
MFQTHSPGSPLTRIERPHCPKCRIRMMLAGIEPSFAGPDLWTFKCPKCELAYKVLAEDPNEITWQCSRGLSSPAVADTKMTICDFAPNLPVVFDLTRAEP